MTHHVSSCIWLSESYFNIIQKITEVPRPSGACSPTRGWRLVLFALLLLLWLVGGPSAHRVAVCCSVWQCCAACCSRLHCCHALQRVAVCSSMLRCILCECLCIFARAHARACGWASLCPGLSHVVMTRCVMKTSSSSKLFRVCVPALLFTI